MNINTWPRAVVALITLAITPISEAQALIAARPADGPGPVAPGPIGALEVDADHLDRLRRRGASAIAPTTAERALLTAGQRFFPGTYRVCVDARGSVSFAAVEHASVLPAFDRRVLSDIRRTWRFRPYRFDGRPTPACAVYWLGWPAVVDDEAATADDRSGFGSEDVARMTAELESLRARPITVAAAIIQADDGFLSAPQLFPYVQREASQLAECHRALGSSDHYEAVATVRVAADGAASSVRVAGTDPSAADCIIRVFSSVHLHQPPAPGSFTASVVLDRK